MLFGAQGLKKFQRQQYCIFNARMWVCSSKCAAPLLFFLRHKHGRRVILKNRQSRDLVLAGLRSESQSGMCAKLHTVAASHNRDHAPQSLCYCSFAPHIYGCCSSHTSRSWWIAHSMQRQRRGCNSSNTCNWAECFWMLFSGKYFNCRLQGVTFEAKMLFQREHCIWTVTVATVNLRLK